MADAGRLYGTIVEGDRLRVAEEEEAANVSLSVFRTEVRRIDPEGRIRWSAFASSPRRLPDGVTCWDGVEIDITERKRVEEALRLSEENYRTVSRMTSEYVFRLDVAPDGTAEMSMVTEGLHRATGRSIDDVRNLPQWGAGPPRGPGEAPDPAGEAHLRRGAGRVRGAVPPRRRRVSMRPRPGRGRPRPGGREDDRGRRRRGGRHGATQGREGEAGPAGPARLPQCGAGGSAPTEGRVPLEHEPRAPDPAERHPGVPPGGPRRRLRGGERAAPALRRPRGGRGTSPPGPDRRHPRPLEGPGRPARSRDGPGPGPGTLRVVSPHGREARGEETDPPRLRAGPRGPDVRRGRPQDQADPRQPPEQRREVHSRGGAREPRGHGRSRRGNRPVLGDGRRDRHRRGEPPSPVQALHAGGDRPLPPPRGLGSRALPRPGADDAARWRGRGREPARGGEPLHRDPAVAKAGKDGGGRGGVRERPGDAAIPDSSGAPSALPTPAAASCWSSRTTRRAPSSCRSTSPTAATASPSRGAASRRCGSCRRTPRLILMDIQMPGMDGLETIRRLREDERLERTPILAVTALAMPGDRERCLRRGERLRHEAGGPRKPGARGGGPHPPEPRRSPDPGRRDTVR
jgi:CheY-like chemotaxis protein/PAS domain-containing protein